MSTKNNNPKGIILILIGMFIVSFMDATFKYINTSVNLYEAYFVRTLISFGVIASYLKITNKPIIFTTHYPLLTSIRVILFFFGFSSFYISLTIMPLAGITFVNTYRLISPSAPFGGMKDSGYGKEAGIESIKDYTRVKTTWYYTSDKPTLDPFSMR